MKGTQQQQQQQQQWGQGMLCVVVIPKWDYDYYYNIIIYSSTNRIKDETSDVSLNFSLPPAVFLRLLNAFVVSCLLDTVVAVGIVVP